MFGADAIGVSFVVHNSDVLFPTHSTNQALGSDVISAIVTGVESVRNLSNPVLVEFTVSVTCFKFRGQLLNTAYTV